MTDTRTPAAVLMNVLDVIESPAMVDAIESAGGAAREDGVQPPLWQLRISAAHMPTSTSTWMSELDHSVAHVAGSQAAAELHAHLLTTAAVAVSWALALEARAGGDES